MLCFLASTMIAFAQSSPTSSPERNNSSSADAQPKSQAGGSDTGAVPEAPSPSEPQNKLSSFPRAFLHDQFGIWTSPGRARLTDATWLVPLGGLSAALFATDSDFSRHLSNDPNTLSRYRHFSDYGVYSMAGGAGGMYLLGLLSQNEHQRETGFLSGESAVDALFATEIIKYAARRERPLQDSGSGQFWKGGTSFPAEHAAAAWSIASMVAHEYPNPFIKFLSYGMATAVSASRIAAKQHFPSDVLVGSAIGYLVSSYVYAQHRNPDLRGGAWEIPAIRPDRPSHWESKFMGSPYVPLDSWVYPALERLTALGYIDSGIAGMRPWTRMECARQVEEASDRVAGDETEDSEAARVFRELQTEFSREVSLLSGGNNAEIRLESAYTRGTEIVGKPLTDGYHFGQTIVNDFGRPEEQGFNNVSGMAGWAADGPFAVYVDSEYQHSPWAPALPLAAREAMSTEDFSHSIVPPPFPVPSDTPVSTVDRGRFLDAYVAMNISDWQFSYGNQSLWWGPGQGGGMTIDDNAEPLRMFRVNRVTPFKLPSFLGVLGPMRMEFFLGQYSGYQFMFTPSGLVGEWGESLHSQPIVHGERFSFKPLPNLEIGLSRTTDYGGPGYPLDWHTFLRSVFSANQTIPGAADKPGSRRSGLDFSYRIHNGFMFYADGFTEHDTFSPLVGPDVAAWLGGIYLPRLPKLPKMDFRAEGVYTDPPIGGIVGSGFFYYDPTWISGFTNDGNLMGHWIGREGQGVQAWTTYWFTPRSKLQFEFRHLKVSHEFVPNGGTLCDVGVHADLWARSIFSVSTAVQYEAWTYPVIATTRQSNITSSVRLSFWPKGSSRAGSDQ
jgi:hypothetical protein